jgi:hypothetical protein
MKFDEIVLVEPGEEGAVFGDDDFWDYVIVEASKDSGRSWEPLLPGYDSGINTIWKATYNSNITDGYSQAQGASNMFRQRTINLLQETSFSDGDEIIIRFRLFSDAFSYGWGWVIEDLKIQADFSGIENDLFIDNNLIAYPNPASGNIFIKGQLTPGISKVWLSMNDLLGRNMHYREVVIDNGVLEETIDLSDFEPGIYVVKINSGSKFSTFKIIVTE